MLKTYNHPLYVFENLSLINLKAMSLHMQGKNITCVSDINECMCGTQASDMFQAVEPVDVQTS